MSDPGPEPPLDRLDDYHDWVAAELNLRGAQFLVDDYNEAIRTRINPWTGLPLGEWFDYFYGDENGV